MVYGYLGRRLQVRGGLSPFELARTKRMPAARWQLFFPRPQSRRFSQQPVKTYFQPEQAR